jgi:hypothetical protein
MLDEYVPTKPVYVNNAGPIEGVTENNQPRMTDTLGLFKGHNDTG